MNLWQSQSNYLWSTLHPTKIQLKHQIQLKRKIKNLEILGYDGLLKFHHLRQIPFKGQKKKKDNN